jgi:hypothetical protein
VDMITTMAMNCMSTRSRMSFWDRCGGPPRIMNHRNDADGDWDSA